MSSLPAPIPLSADNSAGLPASPARRAAFLRRLHEDGECLWGCPLCAEEEQDERERRGPDTDAEARRWARVQ